MKEHAGSCVTRCCSLCQFLLHSHSAFGEFGLEIFASSLFPGIQLFTTPF